MRYTPIEMDELLATLPRGARVLDLGCGKGSFDYARWPALVIDALDEMPQSSVGAFPSNVTYTSGRAEALPYGDERFDLVIANFVLEHVQDFKLAIREGARVLKPLGHWYIAVPNAHSFEDVLYRGLFAGGGHLQRHTFESVMAEVYAATDLKLVSYAEWPAGFTFLGEREGLRALTAAMAEACREALGVDLRARSNYLLVFQRQAGLGRRVFTAVCWRCGAGTAQPGAERGDWRCPACGAEQHTTAQRTRGVVTDDQLEADMRDLWREHPHLEAVHTGRAEADTAMPQRAEPAPLSSPGRSLRIGIVSLIAWDFIHQRPHKFAEELADRGHVIYYIEPADFNAGRQATLTRMRQRVPGFRHVAPRIMAIRPVLYPPFREFTNRQARNRWLAPLVASQLRRLRLDFVIVLAPEYAPVVEQLGVPYAYDHVDDTQFMEHIDTERYVGAMNRLMRGAAFNIYIQEAEARRDPKGVYVANGVDLDQFYPLRAPKLFDAVVLSNIAKWFDMDSILASERRILLIGPMDIDGGDNRARFLAAARPNLAWIPQVDKEVANHWLARAEVGLVPFNYRHPVLRYAMPIKILEYFLAGLPVVTYRNEGITRQYGEMVTYYAGDGAEPLDLDAAIDVAKTKREAYDYRAFASGFQWRDLVGELERHIVAAVR